MNTKVARVLTAMSLALLAEPARSVGLDGDEVQVDLLTQFAGGFQDPTAIVGAGTEFTRIFNPPEIQVQVDLSGIGIVIRYVNGSDSSANIGLVGFDFSDLDLAGGEVIDHVSVFSSSFPQGFFSSITSGPKSISLDVANINYQMPSETTYTLVLAITAPEPAPALALFGSGGALAAFAARRRRS